MQIDIITLFPEFIDSVFTNGINKRAVENGIVSYNCINLRDFSDNAYKSVDDRPYGGGPGMVVMAEPLIKALNSTKQSIEKNQKKSQNHSSKVVYLSPQGKPLNHKRVIDYASLSHCTLICGRYEGIDERFLALSGAEEVSIGDYVLSGGELPAMVFIDAIIRQLPGALGNSLSAEQDSFASGLLDCPHYTRPDSLSETVMSMFTKRQDGDNASAKVPAVLLGGNHSDIEDWRLKQSLGRTWLRRKDLLEAKQLTDKEVKLLEAFKSEYKDNGLDEQ